MDPKRNRFAYRTPERFYRGENGDGTTSVVVGDIDYRVSPKPRLDTIVWQQCPVSEMTRGNSHCAVVASGACRFRTTRVTENNGREIRDHRTGQWYQIPDISSTLLNSVNTNPKDSETFWEKN